MPPIRQHCSADIPARDRRRPFVRWWGAMRGMVHVAARRKLNGNKVLAGDVTQAVFTELARRAAALRPDTVLSAWLHRVACTQAALLIRGGTRRQK